MNVFQHLTPQVDFNVILSSTKMRLANLWSWDAEQRTEQKLEGKGRRGSNEPKMPVRLR